MTISRSSLLEYASSLVKLKRKGREWVGPCPVCRDGDDRFAINMSKGRAGVWNCRICGGRGDVFDLVQLLHGVDFIEAKRIVTGEEQMLRQPRPTGNTAIAVFNERAGADRIIAKIRPIVGTPGEEYLRSSARKIDPTAIADVLNRTDAIGWHPEVYFNDPGHALHGRRLGAIIAVMTDPRTAQPTGAISRTYIVDGEKIAPAKTLGSPVGIVRLSRDDEVCQGLVLAEGLETALTAMAIGYRPTWSTGTAGLMAKFPVLSGVECVNIFADNDTSEAGLKAATECADAWRQAGAEAHVLMRDAVGDLNDAHREAAA